MTTYLFTMTGEELFAALANPQPSVMAQVLAHNAAVLTEDDIELILAGTEGVRVTLHDERKSHRYRVVTTVGVLDAEGGLWLAADPVVDWVRPTRNLGHEAIVRRYADRHAPGLPLI